MVRQLKCRASNRIFVNLQEVMLNRQLCNTLRRMETVFCKYTTNWYVQSGNIEARIDFEDTYKASARMPIPTYDEMKKEMLDKLTDSGFSHYIVSPEAANCVIRIYRKELKINDVQGGLCGAVCFVKDFMGRWTRINKDGEFVEITHGKHYMVTYWTSLLTVYENPVAANYFDVYLKVDHHK